LLINIVRKAKFEQCFVVTGSWLLNTLHWA